MSRAAQTPYTTLRLERNGAIATLTLARASHANALDLAMSRDLLPAALALAHHPDVRAGILPGEGKMFCAGGHLAGMQAAGARAPAYIKELAGNLHLAISRFARMRTPIVAAVNGTAAGAGFSLVCATDLAIAAESAKFTMAYTGAGLSPDGSSSHFLPRIVGHRRAAELMLTNRVLNSELALEWGLINQVVPLDELMPAAEKLAGQLATGPTFAYGVVKKLLMNSAYDSLESQMEHETRGIADCARTTDGQEGIAAFLEKRRPKFEGR